MLFYAAFTLVNAMNVIAVRKTGSLSILFVQPS